MRLRLTALLLLLLAAPAAIAADGDFVAPAPPAGFAEPLATRVATIRGAGLGAHMELLSSPAMEGRGLGTRGLDTALEYAAATMKLAGIQPFGTDGGWYQAVPIRRLSGPTGAVEIERRDGEQVVKRAFACGVDCVVSPQPPQTLTAPVVFAGYGISEPRSGRDDYAGLEVRGRVVMILAGVPAGEAWKTPEMQAKYAAEGSRERFAAKLETARKLGAAAVLAVEDERLATRMAEIMADEEVAFRSYDHELRHEPPMLMRVSRSVACAVLGTEDVVARAEAHPSRKTTPRATATLTIGGEETLIVSRNVAGVIHGSDPALREEAVVIGAHADHLGRNAAGEILPGADDNASGTAGLLEIAKAFAASEPPKRTLVFVFWTGEEEGRFGSVYYAAHPLWPLAKTAAYLNLDMIGHPWLMSEIRTLVADSGLAGAEAFLSAVVPEDFVEPGMPRGVPALEAAVRNSARGNGLAMHIDWTDGKEGGSDYRDFARKGIPFIRFFGNFFPDYHKPGDTFARLDPGQAARVARFAFAAAWELANP